MVQTTVRALYINRTADSVAFPRAAIIERCVNKLQADRRGDLKHTAYSAIWKEKGVYWKTVGMRLFRALTAAIFDSIKAANVDEVSTVADKGFHSHELTVSYSSLVIVKWSFRLLQARSELISQSWNYTLQSHIAIGGFRPFIVQCRDIHQVNRDWFKTSRSRPVARCGVTRFRFRFLYIYRLYQIE